MADYSGMGMDDFSGDQFRSSSATTGSSGSGDGSGGEGAGGGVVKWFWRLVGDLSRLERGLLLR